MAKLSSKITQGIIPISEMTQRTKVVALAITNNSGLSGITNNESHGYAYADSVGDWWLEAAISFTATLASQSSWGYLIGGATFQEVGHQAVTTSVIDGTFHDEYRYSFAIENSSRVDFNRTTNFSGTDTITSSIQVRLKEKPDWADANMENKIAVNAFFQEATSVDAGLLSRESESITSPSGIVTGGTISATELQIARTGKTATLHISYTVGGSPSSSNVQFSGAIPSDLRPTKTYAVQCRGSTGGSYIEEINIDSAGTITIQRRDWAGIAKSHVVGNNFLNISYIIG